jgi:probable addiction module antidote protein
MALKTTKWDLGAFLDSEERIALFLEAAFEDGDPALIAAALGEVARARGMTKTAKDTGMAREALYRALSADGRPEFTTILKVLRSFGLRLSAVPVKPVRPVKSRRTAAAGKVRKAG